MSNTVPRLTSLLQIPQRFPELSAVLHRKTDMFRPRDTEEDEDEMDFSSFPFQHKALPRIPPSFCSIGSDLFVLSEADVSAQTDYGVSVSGSQNLDEILSVELQQSDSTTTTPKVFRRRQDGVVAVLVQTRTPFADSGSYALTLYTYPGPR